MKRVISIMLTLILAIALTACGDNTRTSSENSSTVVVNEGLLMNTVTIPATFFEDTTEDEVKAAAEEAGYQSYKINSDGSVTYTMTKVKHQEILKGYEASINEFIDGLLNGDEEAKVEAFSNIECNDDYSQINIYVNKDTYSTWDSMYALSFYIQGAYYQMFDGVSSEDIDVVVNFIDNITGNVIDSGSYRAWANNLKEPNSIDDKTGNGNTKGPESKTLTLNETVTIGNLMEITLTRSEWVESITPSNTSGFYSYYEDQEGEKYFVIHGKLKNLGSEELDIQWINESEVLLNGTYKFSATMELESNDGTDFYGSAKPLQTLNLIIYASITDEAYEILETIDVTMNIISDSEYVNSYYDDEYTHETLNIQFKK